MNIVAKYSSYRLGNIKIAIGVLIVLSIWCVYDGYHNQKFIDKHTKADGKADHTLIFSQKFPYFGVIATFGFAGAFVKRRRMQLTADDDVLVLSNGKKVPYDNIEEIDHTAFDENGKFSFKYMENGQEKSVTLSKKTWDDLEKLLKHLISKIS
ncbi:MAG: hypothetical protein ACIAQZ_03280 [Sedimentisphaeraceae bacterium JB056]